MIFEDRGVKKEPLTFEELLEHEFLTSFVDNDLDYENRVPWYHIDSRPESNQSASQEINNPKN
jgi:hypothetical protein